MNTFTLGVRGAFRNTVRTISIVIILGLSIGLCLIMLIAHQAVGQKIAAVKSTVGTTITIAPAGYNPMSQANNALTTADLDKVKSLAHITGVTGNLEDRLTTEGTSSSFKFGAADSTNTTSLKSPIDLSRINKPGSGTRIMINGSSQLPADFSPPITVLGTTDPSHLQNAVHATVTSGSLIDGSKDSNNALVSTAMASKNNLKVGSTFTAYGKTLTVAGIFDSGTQGGDNTVVVPLAALERLSGNSGAVSNALANVDSVDNLDAATTAIKNTLGSSADVTNASDQVAQEIQPLNNVQSISLVSLVGAVIAGSVIILLTMVMIVRERRREIGILKAIGASNLRVILQFMSEAVTLTVLGAVIGIIVGVAGGNPVTNMLVTSSVNSAVTADAGPQAGAPFRASGMRQAFIGKPATGGFFQRNATGVDNSIRNIATNIGWGILADGLGAALVIAVIGSALAGWMIARIKPYEVMRME